MTRQHHDQLGKQYLAELLQFPIGLTQTNLETGFLTGIKWQKPEF